MFAQSTVKIPAGESIVLDYPEFAYCYAHLKNKGTQNVEVSVIDKKSDERLRSFGLNKWANEKIIVESTSNLILRNTNKKLTTVRVDVKPTAKPKILAANTRVEFSLQNSSAKSIPLIIPTVMNPNLSPFSKSGVTLKIGQEVLFKAKGKKRILLVVDDSIKDGDVIDVAKLLPSRKRELGIK